MANPLTDERLAEIRARCDIAGLDPWDRFDMIRDCREKYGSAFTTEDRADLPDLLDGFERLRDALQLVHTAHAHKMPKTGEKIEKLLREVRVSSSVTIWVPGRPRPKGSLRPIRSKSTGRTFNVPSSKLTAPWQARVTACALEKWRGGPVDGPIQLDLAFLFVRPRGHYGTGKNSEILKRSAPQHCDVGATPDIDKMIRAILDGLQGVVYRDDKQVVKLGDPVKVWDGFEGAAIRVVPIQDGTAMTPPWWAKWLLDEHARSGP